MAFPIIMGTHEVFSNSNTMNSNAISTKTMKKEKTLKVKEVRFNTPKPTCTQIDSMFKSEQIEFNNIDTENWSGYNYTPDVKFRIAYSPTEIYIQYSVTENDIKATYADDEGSAPYKDSCVEFFCIPDEYNNYYNLELNCIAKGTFAGGAERTGRTKYGKDVLNKIRRHSTLPTEAFGTKTKAENSNQPYQWQVTVALPIELFSLAEVKPLKGRTIKANFFKCGDDMPERHYLSWNPIGTEKPNFHTPEYFGNLEFE